jgi:hypothetical protein
MVAPATTAPEGSTTVPAISPVVRTWAREKVVIKKKNRRNAAAYILLRMMPPKKT